MIMMMMMMMMMMWTKLEVLVGGGNVIQVLTDYTKICFPSNTRWFKYDRD